jgi:hypothetical protein
LGTSKNRLFSEVPYIITCYGALHNMGGLAIAVVMIGAFPNAGKYNKLIP